MKSSQSLMNCPQRLSRLPAPAVLCRPRRQLPQRAVRILRVQVRSAARTVTKGRTKLQGSHDWAEHIKHDGITSPREIADDLRRVLIKYGELTQITYDSFYGDAKDTNTFGLNKYPPEKLFKEILLDPNSPLKAYTAHKYLYAESGMPPLRTDFLTGRKMNRYWQGYCAVSEPDSKGKRDVVFAWRGTIAGSEWSMDVQSAMCNYEDDRDIGVAEGFSTMYMVSQKKDSPQVQVKKIMDDLWKIYGNEIGSLTVCGHSLGGALAHLCAFDLGDRELNKAPNGSFVPITAYTYCSPRVGDKQFKEACEARDVKVLRVENRRDIVPKVPGLEPNEVEGRYVTNNDGENGGSFKLLDGFDVKDPMKSVQDAKNKAIQRLKDRGMAFGQSVYRKIEERKTDRYDEVGTELMFDTEEFPDVFKKGGNLVGAAGRAHNLEVNLHMVDPKRDPALCNKSEDALVASFNVPAAWYGVPFKGMQLQADGLWKRAYPPYMEPESEPEPIGQKSIDEAMAATAGGSFKFPDMSDAFSKVGNPFGRFGRKEEAGKK